ASEQAVGLKEINQAMNQMDQVTQQNAAMVEEATAASVALNDEAQTLKALATRFRVSGSGNAAQLNAVAQQMRAPAASAASPRTTTPTARRPAASSHGSAAVAQDSWEEF
ncbi:methyl-accepting chemotaxis protein, partial [Rhizobium phaseoli]